MPPTALSAPVMPSTERLVHLLALADQGATMRAALAEEVAELLADWPTDCPSHMRAPCEALLARAAREVDGDTRARLRVRLHAHPALAGRLLPRAPAGADLVATARKNVDIAPLLARRLGIAAHRARKILADDGGDALAVAAKGLGLDRAAFSALALLTCPAGRPSQTRLAAYERVTAAHAARSLRAWADEGCAHALAAE